jgi:hypothetical protein
MCVGGDRVGVLLYTRVGSMTFAPAMPARRLALSSLSGVDVVGVDVECMIVLGGESSMASPLRPKVREVHPVEVKVVDEEKEGERTRHASACASDGRQALPHGGDGLDICRQLAGSSADKHREYTCMCIREVELARTHEAPVARLAPRLTAQPLTTKLYARDPLVVVLACRDVAGRPSGNPNVEGAAMSLPADCQRIA